MNTRVKVGDRIRFGDGEQEVVSVENMNNEKKPVIQNDYEFGQWVYNNCFNSAEIRKAVLAHVKRTPTCSFAAGVIDTIKERNSKSGGEIAFLQQCEKANQRYQDLLSTPCNKEGNG